MNLSKNDNTEADSNNLFTTPSSDTIAENGFELRNDEERPFDRVSKLIEMQRRTKKNKEIRKTKPYVRRQIRHDDNNETESNNLFTTPTSDSIA